MKRIVLLTAAVAAIFSAQSALASDSSLHITTESSTSSVRFERLRLAYEDKMPVLKGIIKKQIYNYRVPAGHIDYVVLDPNDQIVTEGGVQYHPSLLLRKWKYGSSFSVALPENLPADAVVKVVFHSNQHVPEK